jgi:hypothetical protein
MHMRNEDGAPVHIAAAVEAQRSAQDVRADRPAQLYPTWAAIAALPPQ